MIRTQMVGDRIRHYSDQDMMIRQIETGILYEDAVDVLPCRYTYEETSIAIPAQDAPEGLIESAEYLLKAKAVELVNTDTEPDYLNEHEAEPNYFG